MNTIYTPPLRVFTIVILTSGDRHKIDVATIEFDPKDLQGNGLNEIHHKIIYICPKYLNENTPEPYREWMAAINDSLNRKVDETAYHVPEIQRVLDMITVDSISPEEGARIIDENNIELLKREWRDEGVKRGIKKGMKEGMEKGIKEGIEKGIKEGVNKGQHQKALEIAKALKASGMTIEQIAQLTSLTLDELNKLT
jgi:hypothetical protein